MANLLFGLREGLGAGLVLAILLATMHKVPTATVGGRASTVPVWLGVLGSVMLTGSVAAVLTFPARVPSGRVQGTVGGLLSVLAAGLVTWMIFRTRRAASGLPTNPRGEVERAAALSAGALTITAFLAVGREGLETAVFLWTTVRGSGSPVTPLADVGAGLVAAVVLCWLLYRQAVRLNAGTFFTWIALALIVIVAGMLACGLGDLQDAGLLSGQRWVAFNLTAHIDPTSWLASITSGVTGLSADMTVLQVVGWVTYLAVVIPAFVNAGRALAERPPQPTAGPAAPGAPGRWERIVAGRPWTVAGILVAVPAIAAGATIAALPSQATTPTPGSAATTTVAVTVTDSKCAPEWTAAHAGTQTFTVSNQSGVAGEINLDNSSGGVISEIEVLGPGTSEQLTATLGGGTYMFKCFMGGRPATVSAPVQVIATGGQDQLVPIAVKPVTVQQLIGPNKEYEAFASNELDLLATAVTAIQADLRANKLAAAKIDWLSAQLDWERTGASYDSFGALGLAVDGLPYGLPDGVNDKNFTGLHRLEYGLWHGQSAASLLPVATTLSTDVAAVQKNLTSVNEAGDPTNLPIRAHEILEDALRDHLSGIDNMGGGAAYAETYEDLQVTRVVLQYLSPLLSTLDLGLLQTAENQMQTLWQALLATYVNGQWESFGDVSLQVRENVDAAIGALLETLSAIPDLLEVPPAIP